MNSEWKIELLAAAKRSSEEQEREFLKLVDQAYGNCSLDTARSLLKTYSAEPDYGTQERVEGVLATAQPEHVTRAILEELPRLMAEAPEWAESLVGVEVVHRLDLLAAVAAGMPEDIKECLRQLTEAEEFTEFYPEARKLVIS